MRFGNRPGLEILKDVHFIIVQWKASGTSAVQNTEFRKKIDGKAGNTGRKQGRKRHILYFSEEHVAFALSIRDFSAA